MIFIDKPYDIGWQVIAILTCCLAAMEIAQVGA